MYKPYKLKYHLLYPSFDSLGGGRNDRSKESYVTLCDTRVIRHAFLFGGNLHLLTLRSLLCLSRFLFPTHHTTREDIRSIPYNFAFRWPKTSLGRRRRFPNQLRGTHPPTQLPQTPDSTSCGLKALRAFAQHTHSSLLLTCTLPKSK